MKKLTLFLVLLAFSANAQKTKMEFIYRKTAFALIKVTSVSEDKSKLNEGIVFRAMDDINGNLTEAEPTSLMQRKNNIFVTQLRYRRNRRYIAIASGQPDVVYFFIKQLQKFFHENEEGASAEIQGKSIVLTRNLGSKIMMVYPMGKESYHSFTKQDIDGVVEGFEKWRKKNG